MKILIVEEELLLAEFMKTVLCEEGFETEWLSDGEEGAAYAETGTYDLLLIDAALSGQNGCKIAERVRAGGCGIPILMYAAKPEADAEIAVLNAGADYYLSRPFDSRRLLACIHALLRRQGTQVAALSVGDTSLNLLDSRLRCREKSVRLSAKEFDVMRYLMASPGQIISKEQILCRVWGFDSNAVENNVEVYVGLLRKKLRAIDSDIHIEAIRRMGYIIEKWG